LHPGFAHVRTKREHVRAVYPRGYAIVEKAPQGRGFRAGLAR
jgi:hypothetical protein